MSREFVMGARINLNMGNYSSGMANAMRSTSQFSQATRDATSQMQHEERAAGSLKDKVFSLKGAFSALAGSMIVKGAFDWLVAGNADMEQYQNTLTVVLGTQKKAVETLAWAQKFAAQTPFEIPQIVEATTRMASYGINAKKTLGIVGDMASVMGKDLMQAVEAVSDAQTGELERMKEFGITKKMITDQAKLMGKVAFDNKGAVKSQDALNSAIFTLMQKRFKGGMEMQSKSFKGMLSNASDFMGSLGRKMGQPLFDKAKAGLGNFLSFLNQLQSSGAIDAFIKKTQQVGAIVGNVFSTAGSYIVTAFNAIKGPATATIGYLVKNFKTLSPYIFGVGSALLIYAGYLKMVALQTKVVTAVTKVWNAVTKMSPIWLVAIAVGLLIGYLIHLAGGWDVVKAKMLALWPVLVNAWKNIMTVVMPILKMIGQKAIQIWQWLVQTVPPLLAQLRALLVTWFTNIWGAISPLLTTLWTGIVTIFNAIKSFWHTWGGLITAIFQVYWAYISSIFTSGLSILWTLVKGAFIVIYNIISGVFKLISGVIQVAWSLISGMFSFWLNVLSGNWKGAWDSMVGMLSGVWSGIKTFFGGLKDLFFDSGVAIIKTLADGISKMAMAPVNAIKSVFAKVRKLLPFSDAKEGPLSNLTHNGGRIVSTMAEGVYKQAGTLHKAMATTLADTPSTVSGSVKANAYRVNPAGGKAAGSASSHSAVKIEKGAITIDGTGKDGGQIGEEILEFLHERLSAADQILGADMGVLLFD